MKISNTHFRKGYQSKVREFLCSFRHMQVLVGIVSLKSKLKSYLRI